MKVEEMAVSECNTGDILATDVFNENGVTLLSKDTILNEYIKEKLTELGVASVRIYNLSGNSEDCSASYREVRECYENAILQAKNLVHDLAAGKPLDYQKVSYVSGQIRRNINENISIIRFLSEIRNADEYTHNHCVNVAFLLNADSKMA